MYSKQELATLWSNDQKRKAFINDYMIWGIWFTQLELDLTFYKYDLPGGGRVIVMEYLRSPFPSERPKGNNKPVMCKSFYLQTGDYFNPSAVSDYTIAERLKDIKTTLAKELAEGEVA